MELLHWLKAASLHLLKGERALCVVQSARFYHKVLPASKEMTTQQEQINKCVRLCQEHFGGAWHRLTSPESIASAVKPLSGGLTNFLYITSLPEGMEPEGAEPRKVLLRFYGMAQGDHTAILKDSLVFALLSERGLGPKFYGCFSGGRFEEYIPTSCLKTYELPLPQYTAQVAKAMANFHLLEMPLCKEPSFFRQTCTSYLSEMRNNMHKVTRDPLWKAVMALNLNLEEEFEWLQNVFNCSGTSVRFCHNDVQEGNILRGPDGGSLVLIDFEYSAYNYRGYDVANHFLEWCYCYDVSEPPYFTQTLENYPTKDQQVTFLGHYLTACGLTPSDEEIDKLYRETQLFLMGPHFLWALWGLASSVVSEIKFGYMKWTLDRLTAYKNHKLYLQQHHPEQLKTKS